MTCPFRGRIFFLDNQSVPNGWKPQVELETRNVTVLPRWLPCNLGEKKLWFFAGHDQLCVGVGTQLFSLFKVATLIALGNLDDNITSPDCLSTTV